MGAWDLGKEMLENGENHDRLRPCQEDDLEGQVQERGIDPLPGGDDGSRFGDRAPGGRPSP